MFSILDLIRKLKSIRDMEPGKLYKYCTCGLSEKDPFCDGSHKGSKFKALKFKIDHKQTMVQLCGCK